MTEIEQWLTDRASLKAVIKLLAGESREEQLRILKERAKERLNKA